MMTEQEKNIMSEEMDKIILEEGNPPTLPCTGPDVAPIFFQCGKPGQTHPTGDHILVIQKKGEKVYRTGILESPTVLIFQPLPEDIDDGTPIVYFLLKTSTPPRRIAFFKTVIDDSISDEACP